MMTDGERLAAIAAAVLVLLTTSSIEADAETRHVFLHWEVSYAVRAPLGVAKRVITINGRLPGPLLNLTTNDVAHVNVVNTLDEPFLLTWNGLQMRRNSWNDGVAGTNCAIPPGANWTYVFQAKDEVGSFFYRPSLGLHAAAGGHGPIRVNNRPVVAVPFPHPDGGELDVLIGDWYNMDAKRMREQLDGTGRGDLPSPDGILINGLGPYEADITFQPGRTYRLRVHNVGARTSLSFRIQGHKLLLVEAEGAYTQQRHHAALDLHAGQSVSVLVTADQRPGPYYLVVSSLFVQPELFGVANVLYAGAGGRPTPGDAPLGHGSSSYARSMDQARSVRTNLTCGAARPNPQGSFRYGTIGVARTLLLRNGEAQVAGRRRCTVNGVSFADAATPLKLADRLGVAGVFKVVSGTPERTRKRAALGTAVIDARYRDFVQIVFENRLPSLQTWHLDGYSFFVAGMGLGKWTPDARSTYNLVDAIYRSTVQVYPASWTAVFVSLDNEGIWNLRSQDLGRRYLGQETYIRVSQGTSEVPNPRDELPMPSNALFCGKAKSLKPGRA